MNNTKNGSKRGTPAKASGRPETRWKSPASLAPSILQPVQLKGTLSRDEAVRLAKHEEVLEKHFPSFIEVGRALAAIRDGKLYRDLYDTFEAYVEDRWGYGRAHSYRLMDSASVMEHLSPIGDKLNLMPTRETHIRPFGTVPKEKMAAVWTEVANKARGKKLTAKLVAEVARPYQAKKAQPGPKTAKLSSMDKVNAMDIVTQAIAKLKTIKARDLNKADKAALRKAGAELKTLIARITG